MLKTIIGIKHELAKKQKICKLKKAKNLLKKAKNLLKKAKNLLKKAKNLLKKEKLETKFFYMDKWIWVSGCTIKARGCFSWQTFIGYQIIFQYLQMS